MQSMFLLAILIIAVSGLIAYIGDWVGRKMGRKRLSLFGLRPRHTAIVISVGSGMFIALLTLVAAFAVSEGVRRAFFTPLDQVIAELAAQKHAVSAIRRELADTRTHAAETTAQLARKADELTTTETRLTHAMSRQRGITRDLATAQLHLRQVNERLIVSQRQLSAAQGEYERVHAGLETSKGRLVQVTQHLLKLETDRLRLEASRETLATQVVDLTERVQVYGEFARGSFSPPVLTAGQEIVSGLVPARASQPQRVQRLRQLLGAAESIVRQQCPELPATATAMLFLGGMDPRLTRLTRDEAIDRLAERVGASSTDEVIVRVTPTNNVTSSGPALIAVPQVELIPNWAVYPARSDIAHVDLPQAATLTRAEVLGILVDDLLRGRVPTALRANGMVMLTRRFDASHPDKIPESAWSLISWAELLTVTDQVRDARTPVRVVARTRTAATRFSPVDLYLEVVPERDAR
jgi:hypothetical protein